LLPVTLTSFSSLFLLLRVFPPSLAPSAASVSVCSLFFLLPIFFDPETALPTSFHKIKSKAKRDMQQIAILQQRPQENDSRAHFPSENKLYVHILQIERK
jgi:hypothetical protein